MELYEGPDVVPFIACDDPNAVMKELFVLKKNIQQLAAFCINQVDGTVLSKIESMLQNITTYIEEQLENPQTQHINTRHVMWLLQYTSRVTLDTAAEVKRLSDKLHKSCGKKDKLAYALRIKKILFVFVR